MDKDEERKFDAEMEIMREEKYEKLRHDIFTANRLLSIQKRRSSYLEQEISERDRTIRSLENIIAAICNTQIKPRED